MKKELNGGVVVGIVIVVLVCVVVFGWRAIAPPAPAGIKSFDKASWKAANEKHAESAAENARNQSELFKKVHSGGQ